MVGLLVTGANRRIVARAVGAVVLIGAFTVTLVGNSVTLSEALILIGFAVNATLGSVDSGAVRAN